MRVINFFLLVLFGWVSVVAGFAADPPPAKSAIPSTGFTGFRFPPSEGMAIERFRMHVPSDFFAGDSIAVGHHKFPGNRMDSSPVCYAMRTYRMAQVSPHSDVTETAGYAECEPSLKYSVKDASVGETLPLDRPADSRGARRPGQSARWQAQIACHLTEISVFPSVTYVDYHRGSVPLR